MREDRYGQKVYTSNDIFNGLMKYNPNESDPGPFLIENPDFDLALANNLLGHEAFVKYHPSNKTIAMFDKDNQKNWIMPLNYKELDIAKYVLDLCDNQAELQRCGEELLMYQERDQFNLLRYLTYLVDLMTANKIIWGVGRGSSVASFVLYKLKVHKVDSMYYQLDVKEFLR